MSPEGRPLWEQTGALIPPFFEAPSTRYYLSCKKTLFREFLPGFKGKRLLKTDLWDEAKNTLILKWAEERGTRVYGSDISSSILRQAHGHFSRGRRQGRFVLADLRRIAFRDNSFDFLYSMGTVEHFPEYRLVLEECYRVLKPGGKAIIGVPNKFDPFLRPLLVWFLNKLSLYAYGFEKSFSFKAPCSLFSNSASSAGLRPAGSPSLTPAGKAFTPATAGAAGLSYGAGGRPELRLLIHPRLGPLDEQAAARSFFEGIGRSGGAGAVMGLAWQEGKLLKVERQPPLSTPSGKILHLHVQAPAGGGAGSEVGVVRQGGAIPEGGAYPEAERAGQAERKGSR